MSQLQRQRSVHTIVWMVVAMVAAGVSMGHGQLENQEPVFGVMDAMPQGETSEVNSTPLLQVLVVRDGVDEEFSARIPESDIVGGLPGGLAFELISLGMAETTDDFEIAVVMALLDPDAFTWNGSEVTQVFMLWAVDTPCSLGCVKCCYGDCGCCCPEPEEEDDGKGP